MTITLSALQKQRYDTAANWTAENPTLLAGEIGVESDTGKIKIGTGSTAWTSLSYSGLIPGSGVYPYSQLLMPSGTAGAPSISFDGDANLGIYRSGTDQISITTGGTERFRVDSAGAATFNNAVTIQGDLTVNGTTTTIDTQNLIVEDKNVIIGNVATPTDTTADGGGITLKGATDKTINWVDSTDAWTSSERFSVPLGSASAPSLTFTGDPNTGIYSPGADQVAISTNSTGRLFVDSSGRVGVGTNSPAAILHSVQLASNAVSETLRLQNSSDGLSAGTELVFASNNTAHVKIQQLVTGSTAGNRGSDCLFFTKADGGSISERMRLDSSGRLGIGSTSAAAKLHVEGDSFFTDWIYAGNSKGISSDSASRPLLFALNGSEKARLDTSGRLLIGTSSTSADVRSIFQGTPASSNTTVLLSSVSSTPGSGDGLGYLTFSDSSHTFSAWVAAQRDGGTWSGSSKPTRLVFSTCPDGSASPVERLRIANDGAVVIGKTSVDDTTAGFAWRASQYFSAVRSGGAPGYINRLTNDGVLLEFAQDSTTEGTISVSGTTVSYNGAHLSRWSQLPSGQERTEILRGSVLSNIDEMCEWGDEDNEQLNRMKVSDVEGDKNVSGVFQAWDDDDDTYTNDFYCAMTGDFIIRIGAGVTVERGDLLMSAGDGTAKPQDDDIIRSKTIAKVTSTNVSCTYDDGSYCVPCVLMAC